MKIERDVVANKIKLAMKEIPFESLLHGPFELATPKLMEIFGDLGQSLGYQVACTKYSKRQEAEWLYDMTWYVLDENGIMIHLPMVLESELNRTARHRDEVDSDFQKLVQARADVRVWISTSPNNTRKHIDNCKQQVGLFCGTVPGDRYVFAIYDWAAKEPIIESFNAP